MQFSSAGSLDPGRHVAHLRVGLRRRRHDRLDRSANPTHTYTTAGTFNATLTRHRPVRRRPASTRSRSWSATRGRRSTITIPRTASSPSSATRSVRDLGHRRQEDGTIDCADVTLNISSATTSTRTAVGAAGLRGHVRTADRRRPRRRTRTSSRRSSATYTDKGSRRRRAADRPRRGDPASPSASRPSSSTRPAARPGGRRRRPRRADRGPRPTPAAARTSASSRTATTSRSSPVNLKDMTGAALPRGLRRRGRHDRGARSTRRPARWSATVHHADRRLADLDQRRPGAAEPAGGHARAVPRVPPPDGQRLADEPQLVPVRSARARRPAPPRGDGDAPSRRPAGAARGAVHRHGDRSEGRRRADLPRGTSASPARPTTPRPSRTRPTRTSGRAPTPRRSRSPTRRAARARATVEVRVTTPTAVPDEPCARTSSTATRSTPTGGR